MTYTPNATLLLHNQIDDMPAGRLLDEMITARIFGRAPYETIVSPSDGHLTIVWMGREYSEEFSWELVEWLHKYIDCAVTIQRNILGSTDPQSIVAPYTVYLHNSNNDSWCIKADADTPALALCRVALKARS